MGACLTAIDIINKLKMLANDQYKNIFQKHGTKNPCLGVKFTELTKIKKEIGINHNLAKELYSTGILEAMYLAGLIADPIQMKKNDLEQWCIQAISQNISEYAVPKVAALSPYGIELGLKWIDSSQEHMAACGWATLAHLVATKNQNAVIKKIDDFLQRIIVNIHQSAPRVRYTMNVFIISVGIYQDNFLPQALLAAEKIGIISVPMPGTACKVPFAPDYIKKARARKKS